MTRHCSRVGCAEPATATLAFEYGAGQAWLADLTRERDPHNYDLCEQHANRGIWDVTVCRGRPDRNILVLAGRTVATRVARRVNHGAPNPAVDAALATERLPVSDEAHERFLDCVTRELDLADNGFCDTEKADVTALIDVTEHREGHGSPVICSPSTITTRRSKPLFSLDSLGRSRRRPARAAAIHPTLRLCL